LVTYQLAAAPLGHARANNFVYNSPGD